MAQWSGVGWTDGVRNKKAPDIVSKTKLEISCASGALDRPRKQPL
jgi:hypothetical protein